MPAETFQPSASKVWISRLLIAVVILLNLQAAFQYLLNPSAYVGAFELQGMPGRTAVMGMGILYIMWQVPYIFAAIHPVAHRFSLIEATIMQAIGLIGETWLRSQIPMENAILRGSIQRYRVFDAGGLVLLCIALLLLSIKSRDQKKGEQ